MTIARRRLSHVAMALAFDVCISQYGREVRKRVDPSKITCPPRCTACHGKLFDLRRSTLIDEDDADLLADAPS